MFALFLVGGLAPVGQTNAADKTEFTGTETFDPYNVLGNGSVGTILDPGTVTCPGHDPTGDPAQPCPPGSRRNIRNLNIKSSLVASDPRYTGEVTIVLNANWDAAANGPVWGTFSLAVDTGGTWDGTFEGRSVTQGNQLVIPLHISGQGTGGAVDGLQVILVDRIVIYSSFPLAYIGSIQGRILDPHSK